MDEDTIRALVAASDRRKAITDAFTPAQASAHARFYADQHRHYLRLSAAKRKQGHGDCSRELAAASRIAARRVTVGPTNVLPFPSQPRERRDRSARSSARSGDSGDGSDSDEPPGGWRGIQPPTWLPGHGDVDGVGDPPPDPIPSVGLRTRWGAAVDDYNGFEVVL